jgi:hypothetical protein
MIWVASSATTCSRSPSTPRRACHGFAWRARPRHPARERPADQPPPHACSPSAQPTKWAARPRPPHISALRRGSGGVPMRHPWPVSTTAYRTRAWATCLRSDQRGATCSSRTGPLTAHANGIPAPQITSDRLQRHLAIDVASAPPADPCSCSAVRVPGGYAGLERQCAAAPRRATLRSGTICSRVATCGFVDDGCARSARSHRLASVDNDKPVIHPREPSPTSSTGPPVPWTARNNRAAHRPGHNKLACINVQPRHLVCVTDVSGLFCYRCPRPLTGKDL